MSAKHTAGSWHVGQGNGVGSVFCDGETRTRYEKNSGTVLYPICTVTRGWNEEEDAANAELIAAAPEMLSALQTIIFQLRDGKIFERDACITQARAAIAKALGSAS